MKKTMALAVMSGLLLGGMGGAWAQQQVLDKPPSKERMRTQALASYLGITQDQIKTLRAPRHTWRQLVQAAAVAKLGRTSIDAVLSLRRERKLKWKEILTELGVDPAEYSAAVKTLEKELVLQKRKKA